MNGIRILSQVAVALATAALSCGVAAIPISTTSVVWSNGVGGSNLDYNDINGDYTDVRWGVSTGNGQSGLGFNPANPPTTEYPADTPFLLGHLRHYNNPIASGTAASSVDLALVATIVGASPMGQSFAFRFLVDETPNSGPCLYPSTTPCADRITFQNLDLTSTFSFSGSSYTLELLGFQASSGSPLSSYFDSQEGGTNKVGLYGRFTSPPTRVPEPASLALLSFGLLVAGFALRRKAC